MKNLIALLAFMVLLAGATWPIETEPSPDDKVEVSNPELCSECKLVMEQTFEVPLAQEIYLYQAQPVNDAEVIPSAVAPDPAQHESMVAIAKAKAVAATDALVKMESYLRVDLHYDPGSCGLAMEWTSKTDFSV